MLELATLRFVGPPHLELPDLFLLASVVGSVPLVALSMLHALEGSPKVLLLLLVKLMSLHFKEVVGGGVLGVGVPASGGSGERWVAEV